MDIEGKLYTPKQVAAMTPKQREEKQLVEVPDDQLATILRMTPSQRRGWRKRMGLTSAVAKRQREKRERWQVARAEANLDEAARRRARNKRKAMARKAKR